MWWLVACTADPVALLDPDPARDGADGADGPYGVARLDVRAPARVSDVVEVALVYPADGTDPAARGVPALVLVHGGLVEPARYEWLAVHAASRGWAVAMPRAPLDLALLASGDARVALDALRDASRPGGPLAGLAPDGPVAAAGHSLGGVVAGNWFLADPEVSRVALLASYPSAAPPDDLDRPALALVGSQDASAPPDTVADELAGWPGPLALGVVDGLTHYGWTDDATEAELGREPAPDRPVPEARRDALRALDAFLDGQPVGDDDLPGITWR